ncbi:MAG: peptide-methionine (S)-S-oxide reductase MsrA [Betaproteobacteria bacterium]|nr:peptide-methionine (S)-S-oxide reductase MsrA [Betaproteobacteria bacterium]
MLKVRDAVLVFAAALLLGLATISQAQAPKPAAKPAAVKPGHAKAVFAGGCFWCMEPPYDKLDGVVSTTSGYIGGQKKNPTYEEVSSGRTGHTEAVEVVYDPQKVSYQKLLDVFWRNIDPTVKDQQFCDVGTQYRSGIFYHNDDQRRLADASKAALEKSKPFKGAIMTEITRATEFYPAEDYHQDYYLKNPVRYKFYVNGCGRYARLKQLWGAAPE